MIQHDICCTFIKFFRKLYEFYKKIRLLFDLIPIIETKITEELSLYF